MRDTHEFRLVLTPFCHYHCFFCHNEGCVEERTPLLLSPKDYCYITKIGRDLWRWRTVTMTGGEPLISPIYNETCERIANEGIDITTVTNGSLVSSPKKVLKHNNQVNISVHSMNPYVYQRITGSSFPLSQILDTIVSIRVQLPDIRIHLNSTVIRGLNDDVESMEKLIEFAQSVGGYAKFVDLASKDKSLVVPICEICDSLRSIGFVEEDGNTWQTYFVRNGSRVIVTRCGFADEHKGNGLRNLFVNPDGVIICNDAVKLSINVLREVHSRDSYTFAKKVEWLFPRAREH